jgi:hypothetical protein
VYQAAANQSAPAHEVVYLDGATGKSKTGYVIDGTIYEDAEGKIPASDYSQFCRADGMLYIRTPYGTIKTCEFDVLRNKQQEYDVQTYGVGMQDADGNLVGTMTIDGRVGPALDSYTSAPNGPGSISEDIFNQYYSTIAGTIPVKSVEDAIAEGLPADSGTVAEETANTYEAAPALSPAQTPSASGGPVPQDDGDGAASGDIGTELQSYTVQAIFGGDKKSEMSALLQAARRAQLQQYLSDLLLEDEI